jgi:small subunit ribosomal protein S2
MIDRRELLFEAGVHYGHRTKNWNPKMKPFIWGEKDGIHLINVAFTDLQINKAEVLLEEIAKNGLPILWVGTKKIVRESVVKNAKKSTSPYLSERWIGGTITNHFEVKKAIKNLFQNKDIFEKSDGYLTKKELGVFKKRIDRAEKSIGGIQGLTWPIGALIVVDVHKEAVAIREARRYKIPIIALVDTNCDPSGIDVVIPANDDLEKSVEMILAFLSDAIVKGKAQCKVAVEKEVTQQNPTENNRRRDFNRNDRHSRSNENRRDFTGNQMDASNENKGSSSVDTVAISPAEQNKPRADFNNKENRFKPRVLENIDSSPKKYEEKVKVQEKAYDKAVNKDLLKGLMPEKFTKEDVAVKKVKQEVKIVIDETRPLKTEKIFVEKAKSVKKDVVEVKETIKATASASSKKTEAKKKEPKKEEKVVAKKPAVKKKSSSSKK